MAKLSILAGATSQSVNIFIQDSSSTTGAGKTGLLFNTASLVAYYTFSGANTTSVAITLATLATVTTVYSSGGFIEIDATNMPGLYRLDLPNAALVSAKGRSCVVMLKGAANMAPVVLEIELTGVDNQLASYGLSLAKTTNITGFNDIAAPTGFAAATFPAGTIANTTNITAGTITTATTTTNLTNLPTIPSNWLTAAGISSDTGFILRTGTATAGTAATLTLDAGASTTVNLYKDCWLIITSGTGVGQVRRISAYSAGRAATVSPAWVTTPDTSSVFAVHPQGYVDVGATVGTGSVGAAGYIGIDWSNVNAPTTALALTNTTISSTQVAASVTGAVGSVTGAVGSVTAAVTITAASVQAIWDALTSALTTVGSIGKLLVDNVNASISAIKAKTDNLPASPAATGDAMALTSGERNSTADAILTRNMTESYAAKNAVLTPAQAFYAINQQLGEQGIVGTTMTVKKRDQSATAKTYTLNDATTPTAITEAS